MANPDIVQNVNTPIFIGFQLFEPHTIFAAEDPLAGQVLGAITVGALVVTADGGNTGDGTVTEEATSVVGGPAKAGDWILTCIEAIADSGRFNLVDPDGVEVASNILIPAGAGNNVVFIGSGLTFKITDGATNFALNDFWTIAVAIGSGKLKKSVSTSSDGSEIPKYVITQTIVNVADAIKSVGKRGIVDQNKLVFEGAETIATLVHGKSMKDWLHDTSIFTKDSQHLDFPDND